MKKKLAQFVGAVDERTGIPSAIEYFLNEEIPDSSGWHQVFGSVAMFLILVQIFTGIMLAFARVAGETAPLLFTAFGNSFWNMNPNHPTAALPLQIFTYAISPFDEWHR